MFGAYFHLPPYFARVINEGSNETLQKCTLIQKAAYRSWAMCFLVRLYMVNGAVYVHLRIHVRAFTERID